MTSLPYALGCPSCPHHVVVSAVDPDAWMGVLRTHLFREHTATARKAPFALLANARELTEREVARCSTT